MLDLKPKPREVFWPSNIQLNTESSKIGTRWRRSGIIAIKTNSEWSHTNTHVYSLRPQWTQRRTEKRWFQSCSTLSKSHNSTSPSKPYCPSMPQEEPLVSWSTLEMVLLTQSPFMKGTLYHTPSWESTWPEETWLTTWSNYCQKSDTTSPHLPKEKSSETSRNNWLILPWISTQKWKLITNQANTIR